MTAPLLAFLSLLLLSPASGDCLGKKRTICNTGLLASISCPTGNILVLDATYGRADNSTCAAYGSKPSSLANTDCRQDRTAYIGTLCEGQPSCEVKSNTNSLGDPCPGTNKYTEVCYSCVPGYKVESARVCDGNARAVTCEDGYYIKIITAAYGRISWKACGGAADFQEPCLTSVYAYARDLCNYNSSCVVEASSKVHGDPCPGIGKYLEVRYACLESGRDEQESDKLGPKSGRLD